MTLLPCLSDLASQLENGRAPSAQVSTRVDRPGIACLRLRQRPGPLELPHAGDLHANDWVFWKVGTPGRSRRSFHSASALKWRIGGAARRAPAAR